MCELPHSSAQNKNHNKTLKRDYDKNPLSSWSRRDFTAGLPDFLFQFAPLVHSVKSSSAHFERQFLGMVWMISKIRTSSTLANANMRFTVANQLPQKRRLLDLCDERKVKRSKLEKSLYELKWIGSPFTSKSFTLSTELWTSLRDCSLSFIFFQNHVPYQIIDLCQWF